MASRVIAAGGEIHLRHSVVGLHRDGPKVSAVDVRDGNSGEVRRVACDQLISTMPIKELAGLLQPEDPKLLRITSQLPYRDFITAGLLVRRMRGGHRDAGNGMPPDNWIYIQEPGREAGPTANLQ